MDKFNLNAMGVKEMDSKEMKTFNGGIDPITATVITIGGVYCGIYALGVMTGVTIGLIKKAIK